MSTLNDKRTRSQLTLPALNPSTLGRSPLKDARLALRNTSNSQSLANPLPLQSKLRASIMATEASDGDDEILLSPKKHTMVAEQCVFKDKKRHSEENDEGAIVERVSKRVKMQVLPSVTVEERDLQTNAGVPPSDKPTDSKGPFDFKPPPQTPQRQSEAASIPAPSIPHLDLKSIASPWKSASPAKQFEKLLIPQTPRQAGAMEVDRAPSSKGQPASHPPSTPRPSAPAITVQPETPEGQTFNPLTRNHGMMGPMSPLTPLPPTPAIFGNTIRAFTAGKNGPGALDMLGAVQVRFCSNHLAFLFIASSSCGPNLIVQR
ncbi:hypothetical protein FIBSPDRAFT_559479 [Athelia psychrophila]|uniref:Uncharacterized protein n=1 Tax=Athelia psychrophila TaxID=1759441 RepID=A0A166I9K6_9AGAM|nr:hypothetical protein FIBSPDRAFT_559479 [Fibularhizoctonia sp. CBS 109695]